MKATFEDFLAEHPTCSQYVDNADAKAIFNFMSEDENIIRMIDVTEAGRPALLGCLKEIESYYDTLINPTFKFSEMYPRTTVGRMVATILKPFGYEPLKQVNFSQTNRGKYFGSASRYEKSGVARLRVVRTIKRV
jgi:hypothetical protein